MIAVVTAGGTPQPGEPLYPFTQGECKALLDIAGKPMIQWVLDALSESRAVDQIVIVGLPSDKGVSSTKELFFVPNQGDLLENLRAGVLKSKEVDPQSHHILSVSSDIPAITGEIVDWVWNTAMETDHDAYYYVITRQVMEARYPNSRRSYVRFRDIELCGGDINVIRTMTVTANDALWRRIVDSRKSALRQASLIGYDVLILLLLHMITLNKAIEIVCRRLKIAGRAVISPYAEVGMDVDKPHQLEIIQADLARRVIA